MVSIKRTIIILIAKLIRRITAVMNMGGGTALPGLFIEKYQPSLFDYYAKQLDQIILITGTNGKTTTKSLLHTILDQAKINPITNKEGSNLKRGLLSTFLINSDKKGKLNSKIALFEVEEATLPMIVDALTPDILIVTNLYRDQLDAYGEVNKTREYIRNSIEKAPKATLILNANDPLVSTLSEGLQNKTKYFSIPEKYLNNFKYEGTFNISSKREKDIAEPSEIELNRDDLSTNFTLNLINYKLKTPGVFHVYNALAAITAANILKISQQDIMNGFDAFDFEFGRGEIIEYNGPTLDLNKKNKHINFKLLLIKNPAGFTLTLDLLSMLKGIKVLFVINDKIADGRDISWLWDAEVERLKYAKPELLLAAGTRAKDMALRLKYAFDVSDNKNEELWQVKNDLKEAIDFMYDKAEENETIYVLPTYTAMNEFRKLLGKKF